jgi:hypothetical protein
MELDDDVLFLLGDVPPLDVPSKIVDPPQQAALATP